MSRESAMSQTALRGLDQAVCAILARRHPGTRWKPERAERDAPAAAGKIGRPLTRIQRDETLLDRDAAERPNDDRVEG